MQFEGIALLPVRSSALASALVQQRGELILQDFFCSQLVAEALKVLGVIPRGAIDLFMATCPGRAIPASEDVSAVFARPEGLRRVLALVIFCQETSQLPYCAVLLISCAKRAETAPRSSPIPCSPGCSFDPEDLTIAAWIELGREVCRVVVSFLQRRST